MFALYKGYTVFPHKFDIHYIFIYTGNVLREKSF